MASAAKLAAPRAEAGVPAAQPGGGDHRGGQRRADHRGQRVQPADQQGFALDLGVPEPGALLLVPVDPFLHRVDVHERQLVLAGQQRRPAGQLGQQLAVYRLELADVPPGIRAQVRPQRGRRADPAEQHIHGPVPQQVHVVDAVRPGEHPGDQAADLRRRVDPARAAGPDLLRDQLGEPGPLRQRHDRDKPGPRHEIRVVEGCARSPQSMQQSHLQGVLSESGDMEALDTPIVPVQRAPFALTRPERTLLTRWIEAYT